MSIIQQLHVRDWATLILYFFSKDYFQFDYLFLPTCVLYYLLIDCFREND